ncbi:MAG: hypothetical protein Q8M62_10495 [Algoriphagus sp.]|nr:hypothetical protein [Algoriphagus sp.]MDP3200247.1 hypothetical protein [Algoriphagus sp.]
MSSHTEALGRKKWNGVDTVRNGLKIPQGAEEKSKMACPRKGG